MFIFSWNSWFFKMLTFPVIRLQDEIKFRCFRFRLGVKNVDTAPFCGHGWRQNIPWCKPIVADWSKEAIKTNYNALSLFVRTLCLFSLTFSNMFLLPEILNKFHSSTHIPYKFIESRVIIHSCEADKHTKATVWS